MHLCWKILEARKAEIIETNASFVPQSTLLLVMSAYCSSYNHYQQSGEQRTFAISSSIFEQIKTFKREQQHQ